MTTGALPDVNNSESGARMAGLRDIGELDGDGNGTDGSDSDAEF